MKGYEKFCLKTSVSLGRALEQKEVEFLSWLYNRYLEESKKNRCVKNDRIETMGS